MAQNYLVVVDVQNDFVTGALGSSEARAIVPGIVARARDFSGTVFLTRDTHYADYLSTREGQLLPVVHCVEGSEGWQFVPELEALRAVRDFRVFDKETFGSATLARELGEAASRGEVASVEFVGLCTDICVVSNALLARSFASQARVVVNASLCAGSTPELHRAALATMKSCQVEVIEAC